VAGLGAFLEGLANSLLLALGAMAVFIAVIVVPAVVETVTGGRSIGKAMFGLRVVNLDGGPVGFMGAFLRALALPFLDMLGFVLPLGAFVALGNRWNQRIGDLLAGTIVVTDRSVASLVTPVSFFPPPGYEAFVERIDTSVMTSEQYRLVRTLLMRAPDMTLETRAWTTERMADLVVRLLRTPAQPGMAAEAYLACVCSAYQQANGGYPVEFIEPTYHWAPTQVPMSMPTGVG